MSSLHYLHIRPRNFDLNAVGQLLDRYRYRVRFSDLRHNARVAREQPVRDLDELALVDDDHALTGLRHFGDNAVTRPR